MFTCTYVPTYSKDYTMFAIYILSREELDQIYQVDLSPPNTAGLKDKHINR